MRRRRMGLVGLCALLSLTATMLGASSASAASDSSKLNVPKRGVVTIHMAIVGDPGNPSVGVVQTFGGPKGKFVDPPKGTGKDGTGIYKSCADAPASAPSCLTVGGVKYTYGIGEFETTVSQYVIFLNTADPAGKNVHRLYIDHASTTVWPQYGPIRYTKSGSLGQHYAVAYPEWAQKPFNFTNFRRAARFVNSLVNGKVLSRTSSSVGAFKYIAYKVRLSPKTEQGMYDMKKETPTRTKSSGFVLPSNNEWVKAAYYDPKHGGTYSYWAYPTGPFNPPNVSVLNPATGDVTNASTQPLSTYNPNDPNSTVDTPGTKGVAPTWCPSQAGPNCAKIFPSDFPQGLDLEKNYMGNVSTVGQTKTTSPWGTYDMAGNVVEILDTLAPQPPGINFLRGWRYFHGGVANAPAYQLEISAFGYNPGDTVLETIYPWLGFRLGIIGNF